MTNQKNMSDCLFCKIIAGEIPAEKVHEDDGHIAFMDIQPVNLGHVLIVPKVHHDCLAVMPAESVAGLFTVAQRIANRVQVAMGADGYNLNVNNAPAAGQVVMHTHIHAIPRFAGDGLIMWGKRDVTADDIREAAERIRNCQTL